MIYVRYEIYKLCLNGKPFSRLICTIQCKFLYIFTQKQIINVRGDETNKYKQKTIK